MLGALVDSLFYQFILISNLLHFVSITINTRTANQILKRKIFIAHRDIEDKASVRIVLLKSYSIIFKHTLSRV